MQWYFVAALLTILTSSQGILTTLSQSDGGYKYDYATVPFLAEVYKLLVSSFLLWRENKSSPFPRMTTEWKSMCLYPIPSLIYLIHNNVQFLTLTYVDTSTYQIMGNLKIVTTGILFRLFLKRRLSNLQWMAIVLLAVGTTTSQVKGCGETACDSLFSAPIQGYMLGILSACLSALAGVYTEFLMKKNNDSLYWQNVQLYMFGVIFNMARFILDDVKREFEQGPWWQHLFNGYSFTTWMVVLNLGSTGLLVSWLMKYADNIVKVYSTSMAMLLTMALSVYLFDFKPTLQLFLGIIICMMSLHMYFASASMLIPDVLRGPEEGSHGKLPLISKISGHRQPIFKEKDIELPFRHGLIVGLLVPWIVQWHLEAPVLFVPLLPFSTHQSCRWRLIISTTVEMGLVERIY
ncbi:hypothetical protein NE237_029783 [Protea cynaroides]|uniref:CMP-sialic acid transporter 1 n=1 Tax=Protea cynaroides TaxID=273540 RepID=A0A9Q0JV49_9MAGN|nr:hypothetical protein NE237_029783 [Protea cynaroides]